MQNHEKERKEIFLSGSKGTESKHSAAAALPHPPLPPAPPPPPPPLSDLITDLLADELEVLLLLLLGWSKPPPMGLQ